MSRVRVLPLDAATYARHSLHADDRVWVEKNCYVDVWIEAVHALGCDPMAMLGFVAALDFEGDQFTFFKPKHDELWDLYGIDVQELNVWRTLAEHVERHVGEGKMVATEADAFHLPDTAGTDYKRQHTKTTIIVNDFDREARTLGYFHNASYYTLSGDDFVQTFRVDFPADPAFMPFFAEVIRTDRLVRRPKEELQAIARDLLRAHVARRPTKNPVARFGEQLAADLGRLQAEGLGAYHAWAFATIRQLGAAMELLALHLAWQGDASGAAAHFEVINQTSKSLILKGARAVNAKKALDAEAMIGAMREAWDRGMEALERG